MQIVTDFIFLGSKITADGDCSHEIKRSFTAPRGAAGVAEKKKKKKEACSLEEKTWPN